MVLKIMKNKMEKSRGFILGDLDGKIAGSRLIFRFYFSGYAMNKSLF